MSGLWNASEMPFMSGVDNLGVSLPQNTSHQLIVIGNGFDMACGLKSGFLDFFEPRMGSLRECRELEGELRFEKMAECGLTAWDIVLSASYPGFVEKGRVDWCDVESAIEHVVRPGDRDNEGIPRPNLDVRTIQDAVAAIRETIPGTKEEERRKRGFGAIGAMSFLGEFDPNPPARENEELARYLLWRYADEDDWSQNTILKLLLVEIGLLEGGFDMHLTEVVRDYKSYASCSASLQRDLVASEEQLFEGAEDVKTTVLSFNYTDPGEISLRNRAVDEMVHVHGRLGEGVVIGIDGTDCMDGPDVLRYTKTYRLLGAKGSRPSSPVAYPPSALLGGTETVAIKFCGHSLAKADYAYFQSMFDMVDLYGGTVTLCFYYSDYCSEEEERTYGRVAKLLASYGKTMDNKDHGKNLIHKLLLENRLVISAL